MTCRLVSILMKRDGLDKEEAERWVQEARDQVSEGSDPEEVLEDEFGLEPDYVIDLIEV